MLTRSVAITPYPPCQSRFTLCFYRTNVQAMTSQPSTPLTTPPTKARRTQAERSQAMRDRLIEATIRSLDERGYAGTTVSTIIAAAQVSRGAPIHHFPTKDALIAATAAQLIRRIYQGLRRAIQSIEASDNRLNDLILASWNEVFCTPHSHALMELMMASRRDEALAAEMRRLWEVSYDSLDTATRHYFDGLHPHIKPTQLFALSHWLMTGMALERHLIEGPQITQHFLQLWAQMLGQYLAPKPQVTTPPPRPRLWSRLSPTES